MSLYYTALAQRPVYIDCHSRPAAAANPIEQASRSSYTAQRRVGTFVGARVYTASTLIADACPD